MTRQPDHHCFVTNNMFMILGCQFPFLLTNYFNQYSFANIFANELLTTINDKVVPNSTT